MKNKMKDLCNKFLLKVLKVQKASKNKNEKKKYKGPENKWLKWKVGNKGPKFL